MYSQIPEENPHLIRLRVWAKVSKREYQEICALLSAALEKQGAVDLLCEMDGTSFTRPSFLVLWEGARVASANLIKLRRVAVVAERRSYKWARVLVRGFHAETRYYDPAHRTRALRWLEKTFRSNESQSQNKLAGDAGYRIEGNHGSGLSSKRKPSR